MSDPNTIAVYTHLLLKRQRAVKSAQSGLKSMVGQAKGAGVHWADVQAALKEYEMSADARREKAERQANVLSALGVPVQLEMFDALVPRDNDETAQARRRGWYAAIHDQECAPPYPPGSPEGQAWMAGWQEFHDALTTHLEAEDVRNQSEDAADEAAASALPR